METGRTGMSLPKSEAYVIGSLIRYPELISQSEMLTEADFTEPNNRRIYATLKRMMLNHRTPDFAGITDELASLPDGADLMQYIIDSMRGVTKTMFQDHVNMVRASSRRRNLVKVLEDCANDLADQDNDFGAITDRLANAIKVDTGFNVTVSQTDAAISAMNLVEARGSETPYTTGIPSLDSMFAGGLHRGELTIIGARPSVGKTALSLWFALNIAMAGKSVIYISREMQSNRLILRMIQGMIDFAPYKFRTGKLTENEWLQTTQAISEISHLPITFIEHVGDIERLRSEIRSAVNNGKCDVVIIDYLQLIRSTDKAIDKNEYARISYVSRILKEITLELNIPVVALAQVNRSGDKENPSLSELKGSGSIEQDADNVILLHRTQDAQEALPEDRASWSSYLNAGFAYLILNVAKQRDGITGTIPILFNPTRQTYTEIKR